MLTAVTCLLGLILIEGFTKRGRMKETVRALGISCLFLTNCTAAHASSVLGLECATNKIEQYNPSVAKYFGLRVGKKDYFYIDYKNNKISQYYLSVRDYEDICNSPANKGCEVTIDDETISFIEKWDDDVYQSYIIYRKTGLFKAFFSNNNNLSITEGKCSRGVNGNVRKNIF